MATYALHSRIRNTYLGKNHISHHLNIQQFQQSNNSRLSAQQKGADVSLQPYDLLPEGADVQGDFVGLPAIDERAAKNISTSVQPPPPPT